VKLALDPKTTLPADGFAGTLIGRAWLPAEAGPAVVAICQDGVFDITRTAPTMSELLESADPVASVRRAPRDRRLGDLGEILANTASDRRDAAKPWFLAPVDLQALKAAGVTFAQSLLERVIEEQSRGDPGRAEEVRTSLTAERSVPISRR
jgi:fumarylacetoacetate (FAA) hydrolase family protein